MIKEPEGVIYVERLKPLNMDGQCCPDGVELQLICKPPCGRLQTSVGVGPLASSKGEAGGRNVMLSKQGTTS